MVTKVQRQDSIKSMHTVVKLSKPLNDTIPILSHYTDLVVCIECMWTKIILK